MEDEDEIINKKMKEENLMQSPKLKNMLKEKKAKKK